MTNISPILSILSLVLCLSACVTHDETIEQMQQRHYHDEIFPAYRNEVFTNWNDCLVKNVNNRKARLEC